MNEIAELSEHLDADVMAVAEGLALDPRIGPDHLRAGIGFGGACLPKDLDALRHMSEAAGAPVSLLRAVADLNHDARRRFVERLERFAGGLQGRTIGLLGLAFKEGTADFRGSPALDVVDHLRARGASVQAYDPMARSAPELAGIGARIAADAYAAARDADVVCLVTAWPEFLELDFARIAAVMRGDLVFDGRNMLDAERVRAAGLRFAAVGRPATARRPMVETGQRGFAVGRDGLAEESSVPPGRIDSEPGLEAIPEAFPAL